MRTLELEEIADFGAHAEGGRLVAFSVGHNGEPLLVFEYGPEDRIEETDPEFATFPKSRADAPHPIRVVWKGAGGTHSVDLQGERFNFHFAQLLPNDRLLLVCARARRFEEGEPERNARVYSKEGTLEAAWCFGDGISDVQVDASGRAWVSYFDEGVFGNFGWGTGKGPVPIGESGLVAFDTTSGARVFAYEAPDAAGPIDDCYALSVSGEETWAYYYSDFWLARIVGGRVTGVFRAPIEGSRCLAVAGELVLLHGSYESEDTILLQLKGDALTRLGKVKLEMRGKMSELRARGAHVLARSGFKVFRGDLRTLAA